MASDDRDGDVNMSVTIDTEKSPPPVGSTVVASMRSSVPNDVRHGVQEPEDEGSGQEPNENKETLDDNTIFESMDSNQADEAQQQSSSSTIVVQTCDVPWGQRYEIKTDDVGEKWFCAAGIKKRTVYHSDIRYDLEFYSELSVPRSGRHFRSKLGAGTDDKTSYHPLFDFCGKDRADRPESLFCLYRPSTKYSEEPTQYLLWDGRVVLDYKHEPIRAFNIPLTISSKIGYEEARLEAMLRSDPQIKFSDILARILRRGVLAARASTFRNSLNMRLVRFRISARLLSFDPRGGSEALKNYLLSTMTSEMVAKNTTRGLVDLDEQNGEKMFIELLNQGTKDSRKADSGTPQGRKKEQKRRRELTAKLSRAKAWAQAQIAWEAQTPTPAPSVYRDLNCTAIESIIAFKLASMSQYQRDGRLAFHGAFTLDNAASKYPFDNPGMEKFFGGPRSFGDNGCLNADSNDPYGLLGSQTVAEAQSCLVDFLIKPARMQYRQLISIEDGLGGFEAIFQTNPQESYWQQLKTLQSAFERDFEILYTGRPPVLYGLLQLDYSSMRWNSEKVPFLALVHQSIDSSTRSLAIWQRRQAKDQRSKLGQLERSLDGEEEEEEEEEDDDDMMMEDGEGGKDVLTERGGGAEEVGEGELEEEEEL